MKKIFTEGMRDIGIPFTDPEGTYFVLADISPYLKNCLLYTSRCV